LPESNERGALTEAVFYILLSLYKPLHGYGIMQMVKEMSSERVDLGAGTLYGAINTLLQKEWIEPHPTSTLSRKKEYVITSRGREVVRIELDRLRELLTNGEKIAGGDSDEKGDL
jgi:DNA-binding PadR family transcriptional regulator